MESGIGVTDMALISSLSQDGKSDPSVVSTSGRDECAARAVQDVQAEAKDASVQLGHRAHPQ